MHAVSAVPFTSTELQILLVELVHLPRAHDALAAEQLTDLKYRDQTNTLGVYAAFIMRHLCGQYLKNGQVNEASSAIEDVILNLERETPKHYLLIPLVDVLDQVAEAQKKIMQSEIEKGKKELELLQEGTKEMEQMEKIVNDWQSKLNQHIRDSTARSRSIRSRVDIYKSLPTIVFV